MNRSLYDDDMLNTDDLGAVLPIRNLPRTRKAPKPRVRPPNVYDKMEQLADVNAQKSNVFHMSYHAARHEAIWLKDSLEGFFDQKFFDDVLRMVKGGKEASVYLCQGNEITGAEFVAAKVYRPRRFRNLKNDGLYREGRGNLDENGNLITNSGKLHAIRKKTEYGRELLHTSWLEHEVQTLQLLHDAGADVPKPYASGANAILMEYFGDDVMSAPTLNDVDLDASEVRGLYERVIHNIDLMLSHHRIHADLSAFNILYWDGDIVVIDFPQAVHPQQNASAYRIFERDVVRVCEYFDRYRLQLNGIRSDPRRLAADLWRKYNDRMAPQIDPRLLVDDSDDRDLWEDLKNA